MYFNLKYKRTGRLYENTFKSSHIGNDRYLKYIFAYIHLNPAKLIEKNWKEKPSKKIQDIIKFIETYEYSSFYEYTSSLSAKKARNILNADVFPRYFNTIDDYKDELFDWLTYYTG